MLFSLSSYSQEYVILTIKEYSHDSSYCINVTGRAHDGLYGECQYVFKNSNENILWEKSLEYLGTPKLSSNGDIAIPIKGKILFSDTTGEIINEFREGYNNQGYIKQGGFCDDIWHPLTHGYSKSGNFYFISTGSTNSDSTRIHCLTKQGKKKWETKFADYCPDNINTINDIVLLDDFNRASLNWENSIELIRISSGERIKSFNLDIKNPSITHLFIKDSTFILYDQHFKEYASNGEFVKILSDNEVKAFLFSKNDKMIVACIHYFNNYGNSNLLKSEPELLCDLSEKESLKRYHELIVNLINKIGINCEKK